MFTLIASSEAVPFCKTGGLGDVCGSLPQELLNLGQQVAVVLPAFRQAMNCGMPIEPTGISFTVPIGNKNVAGEVFKSHLPNSDVPVYLIRNDHYFDRKELYREDGADYQDNCERFVFFSRAVLELATKLEQRPDVIHCNDWQTGLIPAYLRTEYAGLPEYEGIATLFTIHNLAYQGNFWHWDMELTGIDWKHFNWQEMEFFGNLSFLKSGIAFAEKINTVSPTYAKEIQTQPLSCGMEGSLRFRSSDLSGIINGVDYRFWDPANDEHLNSNGYENYNVDTFETGKAKCKSALQRELGLPEADVPLIGIVGRLVDQKGFDLIAQVIERWAAEQNAQWAILGTGEENYHKLLTHLSQEQSQKVAVRLAFSNELAHRIEAGADFFLMPSRFEPCGLNQLYSLRYGTVPVVRSTGGLSDTIVNANEATMAVGSANGFAFQDYSANALDEALHRAVEMFTNQEAHKQLVRTGMEQDWSWNKSALAYQTLYQEAIKATQALQSNL